MRVIVTGGAGYIGSHVVRALQRAGHAPIVLDDLSTGHLALVERNGVELIQGDVGSRDVLEQAFTSHRPEAVIHLAGLALVGESVDDPAPYFAVNTVAGYTLLEAMRAHGVDRIVFSSTCAVYGVPEELPITERSPLEPVSPYGASKLAFERMLFAYARAYGLKALSLRFFNVAGADPDGDLGEMRHEETHLLPLLLRAARRRELFELFGTNYRTRDGSAERDYVHVVDIARAFVHALERLEVIDPLPFGGALNLGTGRGTTVREMIAATERELGCEIAVKTVPRRAGDPPALVADPSLSRKVLGFGARHDVATMIRSANRFLEAEIDRGADVFKSYLPGGSMPNPNGGSSRVRFGEAVVSAGILDEEVVAHALKIQRDRDGIGESHKLLGLILLEMGAISNDQLIGILKRINVR